eukprot:gnl/TRDRNA2_/TRDRNA2_189390_c0_seq1.p1 gnl/TRDRNA2_/TRDRNA2_189390_c0~~gnl/TRDRNA2_/TRDRNA2_189390_c0_seq1.p1  ORF type:complete len:483 (+),score=121.60 gnl/TRDRNA2_/TRDRNA2_189390_c0_seq1:146-1450(+)
MALLLPGLEGRRNSEPMLQLSGKDMADWDTQRRQRAETDLTDMQKTVMLPNLLTGIVSNSPCRDHKEDDKLSRDDFKVLELLGSGAYGEVKLVESIRDGELYAMKAVEKADIRERRFVGDSKAVERAQAERDIGVAARNWKCPFIVELIAAFQTPEKLYFVYEFCPGGELLGLLNRQPGGRFPEPAARFYLAEVSLALAYLHDNNYLHRDIKLENILIGADCHVRLADFGCAKCCLPKSGTKSIVEVASPLIFMPPEYRRGELYGKSLDCWQLGVAAFAMFAGAYPEVGDNFPGSLPADNSAEATSLCRALLHEDQEARLGHPHGASLVASHEFFAGLDWDSLRAKELSPPFEAGSAENDEWQQGIGVRGTLRGAGSSDILRLRGFFFDAEQPGRRTAYTSLASCGEEPSEDEDDDDDEEEEAQVHEDIAMKAD